MTYCSRAINSEKSCRNRSTAWALADAADRRSLPSERLRTFSVSAMSFMDFAARRIAASRSFGGSEDKSASTHTFMSTVSAVGGGAGGSIPKVDCPARKRGLTEHGQRASKLWINPAHRRAA